MLTPTLCIDIGGTQTRMGISVANGARSTSPNIEMIARFVTMQDYNAQIAAMRAAVSVTAPLAAVGVSIGAQLARDGRSVLAAPNLPEYVGRGFAVDLEAIFGCPVALGHDTVCALIAERAYGHLGQYDRCAYMTLSTGNGAAFCLKQGARELICSIEFAHQILDGNDRRCLCGQTGCLETFTGGRQMARFATAEEMATDAFWEVFCQKLALGLINLAKLTRAEGVAVGGAIALNHPALLPMVQELVRANLAAATLDLFPATLGEIAPLVGAALLPTLPTDHIAH